MKRYGIIFLLLITAFTAKSQDIQNYIDRGNEAMNSHEYALAKTYYDAVVFSICDKHSISQLTNIWLTNESMRSDMRNTMRRCFSCLDDEAKQLKDTASIQLLITYYTEGIGTSKNEEMSALWNQQLEVIRNPSITLARPNGSDPPREKVKMNFFAGYHFSPVAPFGIQVGGMGKSVGWYVRFRSNFSFQATQYVGEIIKPPQGGNYLRIPELDDEFYRATDKINSSCLMGSAGIMFKAIDNMYISAGIGYWDRQYAGEFEIVNDNGTPKSSGWAKVINNSINGVVIELDGMYVISGKFYGTIGGSLMSFKYLYPNVGVGIFF